MNNLIKYLVVALVISITSDSYSQTFGVKAGLNLSKMLMKDDYGRYPEYLNMKPGFHIGGIAEFPLTEVFSFEPELLLSTKGYKWALEGDIDVNLYYIDIPLNVKAAYNLGKAKIYGTFGPYLGMGVYGKSEYDLIINGQPQTGNRDIKWGTDEGDSFKRFDFGLVFGVGVEHKSLLFGASYELGLWNIGSNSITGNIIYNRVIGISVAYKFK